MSDIYDYPKQVIIGVCPSKSNMYKIITFKNKDKSKEHASLAKTPAMVAYENSFYLQCNQYRNKNISSHFELHIDVFYPSNRSDLDNAIKGVLDILAKKVKAISNDNLCVAIGARKFVDKTNPRIEFYLKPA